MVMLYYQVQCLELKMGIIYTVVVTGFNQVGSYNIGNFDNICAYGSDALDQSFIKLVKMYIVVNMVMDLDN